MGIRLGLAHCSGGLERCAAVVLVWTSGQGINRIGRRNEVLVAVDEHSELLLKV